MCVRCGCAMCMALASNRTHLSQLTTSFPLNQRRLRVNVCVVCICVREPPRLLSFSALMHIDFRHIALNVSRSERCVPEAITDWSGFALRLLLPLLFSPNNGRQAVCYDSYLLPCVCVHFIYWMLFPIFHIFHSHLIQRRTIQKRGMKKLWAY